MLSAPLVDQEGKIVEKDERSASELSCFEDAAMIAMAGPVAETIYWQHRTYDDVLSKNRDDEGKVVTITRKVWPSRANEVEAELHERVRRLLEEQWERVHRLAQALEKEWSLDGAAAIEILGG